MARVHCPDCEMAVVVDPLGICPEGHKVGTDGAGRIASSLGDATPHPDEPEPWSAEVAPTPTLTEAPDEGAGEREIRPVSLGDEPADGVDPEPADNDDLLRELHALSGLNAAVDERPSAPPPSAPPTSPATTAAPSPRPTFEERELPPPPPVAGWPSPNVPNEAPPPPREPNSAAVPPPTQRRAPAARSDESLDAIAELSALFDSAGIADAAEADAAETAPGSDTRSEHMATVSHLPVKHLPDEPSPREQAGDGEHRELGHTSQQPVGGESLDWTHFTARGKKRRFGR